MKKMLVFAIIMLGVVVACQEDKIAVVTPDTLATDPTFVSIMKINSNLLQRFDVRRGATHEDQLKFHQGLEMLMKSAATGEEVAHYLGFQADEFRSLEEEISEHQNTLFQKYPNLRINDGISNIYRDAASLYIKANGGDQGLGISGSSQGRSKVAAAGCEGGVTCMIQANHCRLQAEEDFAVASASCSTLSFVPGAWALCQGTAFLTYSADQMDCAYNLEVCCNLPPRQTN